MIEVNNLCKSYKVYNRRSGLWGSIVDLFNRRYKMIEAVKSINIQINEGEIVGYIGMNGAGKSTTLKMLTGIIKPTSGTVKVKGLDPFKSRKKHSYNIGVVFGQRTQLHWDLAVIETYELLRNMYDIPVEVFQQRLKCLNDVLGFEKLLTQQVRKLSLGQRMLCDIAASFIHMPSVIFLDEPTIGLDLITKEKVHHLIKAINRDFGTTFIITTHDISDIERLCDRILIIDKGQIIYDGTLDNIYESYGNTYEITFEGEAVFDENSISRALPYGIIWNIEDNKLKIRYNKNEISTKGIMEKVFVNINTFKDVNIDKISLESIVKNIYEEIFLEEANLEKNKNNMEITNVR